MTSSDTCRTLRWTALVVAVALWGTSTISAEPTDSKSAGTQESSRPMQVEVFKGDFATVNSFIFSNGQSLVVMDVQRTTSEAKKLADIVKSKGLPLTHVLISHGHTDHFTGMDWFHKEFPSAQIVVASEEIKRDIKNYAIYMDTGGETGAEPALEPGLRSKSPANPRGFDYENNIHVLPRHTLTMDGGGTLEITTDYEPAEAPHMATVYSKDLNALFLSDFGYNKVHLWMGDDITDRRIANWRENLQRIKARYAGRNPTIYPGHGDPGDMTLIDTLIRYIDDFTRVTSEAKSRQEAMTKMMALYPDYKQADFFLKYSVENHVK
jgi:glyoxylase-like metal-dependent hydrolase (beta-lactamase superfamily II)